MNKIFVVFAIILISAAPEPTKLHEINAFGKNLTALVEYFTGVWSYFNLVQVSAYTCFNESSAGLFFEYQLVDFNLTAALVAGNRAGVIEYASQVQQIAANLADNFACLFNTTAYDNLITAAGGNLSDPNFQLLENLYFQAYLPEYYIAIEKSIRQIENKKYLNAGVSHGSVLQTEFKNSTEDTFYYEAFKAFQNGIWFILNLTAPYELGNCYNESLGQSGIEFYYYWAQVVNQSTLENVANNTMDYLNGAATPYLNVVGVINECLEQTGDQQRLTKQLGWDVHSEAFDNFIYSYFYNETLAYYETMTIMWNYFEQQSAYGAGELMGQFYYNVAVYANASSQATSIIA